MTASPPRSKPPGTIDFHALALEALLDHLNRGSARHALQTLRAGLERQLGGRCMLQALADDGTLRWGEGGAGSGGDGWTSLPLQRLGRSVGRLLVERGPAPDNPVWRPLLTTLAALLLNDDDGTAGHGSAAPAAMLRAALAGAGTFVWEWDLDNDGLGDIDEGLQQLGYEAGEIGRTQDDWNALIHPDDREANHQAYLRHAAGELAVYEHAYRARSRNGQWRWFQERGRIVERHADGTPRRMLGTQTDISEQKAAELTASLATARLEKIARHAPGLLYQFELPPGGALRFSYVSQSMHALFGVTPAQALADASTMFEAIVADDRQAVLASVLASGRDLGEWRHEFRVSRADGPPRWLLGSSTPQREADGTVVWHGTVQDITEDITKKRELDAARQATVIAEAANRAKTTFLSRMSHELRTPLNAVLGFAQLMEIDHAEPPSPTQRRRLALIRQSGEHLLQMIGDLLDLTRIEAGGMALQIERTALAPLADECVAMLQGAAASAGVVLALKPPPAALRVLADPTRLRQVLLNLLGNAIKYNRPGGHAELRWHADNDGRVVLQVADDGIGIAADELPRLFEPFYRSALQRDSVDGAGIGLSVTQALVSLMGGQIGVESRLGAGAVFTVSLPAA
jgi:PAS domain S-box-containing protein